MESTPSTVAPVSPYWTYVEGFRRLAREGQVDRLADVLLARLDGIGQPVHELISPPLAHEEPDRVQALSNIFHHIKRHDGPEAVRYFRRTVVDQLIHALITAHSDSDQRHAERQGGLERLLAYCRVIEDPELAERLRLTLWGILTTRLEKPFPDILELSDTSRRLAYKAFDLWLSVTPPDLPELNHRRGLHPPQVQLIVDAFTRTYEQFPTGNVSPWSHTNLLLLIYRGLMKSQPFEVGQDYFWRICKLTEGQGEQRQALLDQWQGLWWEYGNVFRVWPEWRSKFMAQFDLAVDVAKVA